MLAFFLMLKLFHQLILQCTVVLDPSTCIRAHRIRQLESVSIPLPGLGREREWSGWQDFSGNPGFLEH